MENLSRTELEKKIGGLEAQIDDLRNAAANGNEINLGEIEKLQSELDLLNEELSEMERNNGGIAPKTEDEINEITNNDEKEELEKARKQEEQEKNEKEKIEKEREQQENDEQKDQEKKEKLDSIQLKDKKLPIVLVFGGSQGAQSINNAILGIVEQKLNTNYQIIWAAGKGNYEQVKNELATKNIDIDSIENAKILPYIYNMQEMMNIADLVVCRSGAMTISEITILEKPAIFIPFPFAAENHQEYNARVLEKIGAAKIILDKDLNAQILNNQIGSIVANASILQSMGKNAGKIKIENVEDKIYSEIKESLNGR